MTPDRLAHLTRMVATITSLEELDGFRRGLSESGELTTDVMAAIRDRQDRLANVKPATPQR